MPETAITADTILRTDAATVILVSPPPRLPEVLPIHEPTAAGQLAQIADVLERFHHEAHPGPFRFCYERPCQEIGGIMRGVIHQ